MINFIYIWEHLAQPLPSCVGGLTPKGPSRSPTTAKGRKRPGDQWPPPLGDTCARDPQGQAYGTRQL